MGTPRSVNDLGEEHNMLRIGVVWGWLTKWPLRDIDLGGCAVDAVACSIVRDKQITLRIVGAIYPVTGSCETLITRLSMCTSYVCRDVDRNRICVLL